VSSVNQAQAIIHENFDLTPYNTFGIAAETRYFSRFSSVAELKILLLDTQFKALPRLCLGGGSNVLFIKPFPGIVLRNEIPGIEVLEESTHTVKVKVGAGVVWNDFVQFCLQHQWGGVENLALIPGSVGAAPIQNIGAYGVEVKDVIEAVEVLDVSTMETQSLMRNQCQFGYRDSVFKRQGKGRWIVTAVEFTLTKNPQLKTHYGAIESELLKMGVKVPTLLDVAMAVTRIRQSKLPDPKHLGNAGSFFKNPVIPKAQFAALKQNYPDMVGYPDKEGFVKVAAGWLIESCGLKGYRMGSCGVHKEQALVLVNYGGATGYDILELSEKVKEAVQAKFQIGLEAEVNLIRA
jgi:UDP-N-acetylmuramate dehydrogenase